MYYYNSAYTTYNYAAGALGILVVAVVLTALLLVLVLPKQKDGHLPAFFQLLYDLFTPKALMIEKLLQVLYVFLNCLTVLFGIAIFFNGFFAGFGRIVLGLVILVAIPLPGTGAWTGALVAAFLDMRLRKAMPAIFAGVLIAGFLITGITYGFTSIF